MNEELERTAVLRGSSLYTEQPELKIELESIDKGTLLRHHDTRFWCTNIYYLEINNHSNNYNNNIYKNNNNDNFWHNY